jgi:hypothetical protein
MHRVARELAHQECGWKHSEGHGVVALDYEGVRHVGLDKMCLLMEVRLTPILGNSTRITCIIHRLWLVCVYCATNRAGLPLGCRPYGKEVFDSNCREIE